MSAERESRELHTTRRRPGIRQTSGSSRATHSSAARTFLMPGAAERDEFGRRKRLADPEALKAMAAARAEKIELRACGHAFGDHTQSQPARQRDDRLRDRGVARVGLDV